MPQRRSSTICGRHFDTYLDAVCFAEVVMKQLTEEETEKYKECVDVRNSGKRRCMAGVSRQSVLFLTTLIIEF